MEMTSASEKYLPRTRKLTSEHRIITDAAVRRFQCQRAYLRAHAGLRWMNSRYSILRGQRPNASHHAALAQVDGTLRNVCRGPLHHTIPCLPSVYTTPTAATNILHRSFSQLRTLTSRALFATRTLLRASGSPKTLHSLKSSRRSCADEHHDSSIQRPSRNLHYCIWAFSLTAPRISYSIPILYYVTRHRNNMALQ